MFTGHGEVETELGFEEIMKRDAGILRKAAVSRTGMRDPGRAGYAKRMKTRERAADDN